jgi:hypothetical protein
MVGLKKGKRASDPMTEPTRHNPYISETMQRFLAAIRDSEEEYAIQEGLEVWAGSTRFHSKTVLDCLRLCLISEDPYGSAGVHLWTLNEDGEGVLGDPAYIPRIIEARKK